MKKELFKKISVILMNQHGVPKITETEEFIAYSYTDTDNSDKIKAFKEELSRTKTADYDALAIRFSDWDRMSTYRNIVYDKIKDKISYKVFTHGWKYAYHKRRFYPFKDTMPILCYSKYLYMFMYNRKGKVICPIRTVGGKYSMHGTGEEIMKAMLDLPFTPTVPVVVEKFKGMKDEWELIEKETGIKLPKSIRKFLPADVYRLIKVMRDTNELQTLYKYLANPKRVYAFDESTTLMRHVSECIYGTNTHYHILNDYVNDMCNLKKKDFSFKIKSVERILSAHRKTSRLIMAKGIKEVKVAKVYDKVLEKLPIEGAELIKTKKRLIAESINQDHCVATYAEKINRGDCCIISLPWEGAQWTVQLSHVQDNIFVMKQCRGLRNQIAPKSLTDLLNKVYYGRVYSTVDINAEANILLY